MGLLTRERIFFLTIYDGGPYHIETSFYMLETFVMKELNKRLHDFKWRVAYYQEEEVFERKMSTQESGMLLQYEKKNYGHQILYRNPYEWQYLISGLLVDTICNVYWLDKFIA